MVEKIGQGLRKSIRNSVLKGMLDIVDMSRRQLDICKKHVSADLSDEVSMFACPGSLVYLTVFHEQP